MTSLIRMLRSATTGAVPAAATSAEYGEPAVNLVDQKIYMRDLSGVPHLVADRISPFSNSRAYETEDIVVQNDLFWMANQSVSPGAFNAAQWDPVGGGEQAAVLLNPPTDGHNTIDLTGIPSRLGLMIQGDDGQTANLLEIPGTSPADSRSATIDALGFPNARFGPSIFRVSQATHPFSFRGQAVAFTGGQWVLADASNANRAAYAVIEQIIDANSFVLRTGGRIDSLQPGAFAGGTISNETTYYVSDTVPGQLTDTPSEIRSDPVLHVLNSGSAILLAGTGATATEFVRLIGDTMTGPLTLTRVGASNGELRFEDANTRIYRVPGESAINFTINGTLAAQVDPANSAAATLNTVITRRKGDNRYLQLTGGELSGDLTISNGFPRLFINNTSNTVDNKLWGILGNNTGSMYFIPYADGGGDTLTGRFILVRSELGLTDVRVTDFVDNETTLPGGGSFVTRDRGDNRYLQLSGGTLTGTLVLASDPSGPNQAATKRYVDDNTISESFADGKYVPLTRQVNSGTGTSGGGSLGVNRTISLDLSFTDSRYLRINAGTGSENTYNGRLNIDSTSGSGAALVVRDSVSGNALVVRHNDVSTFYRGLRVAGNSGPLELNHGGFNAFIDNQGAGDLEIRFAGSPLFRFDAGGGLPTSGSVVTRSAGDDRYVNHDQQLGGSSQSWQGVLGSRSDNTWYSNNTGAPIQVFIMWGSGQADFALRPPGGNVMTSGDFDVDGSDTDDNVSMIIPDGWDYKMNIYGGTFKTWWELR